MIRFLFLIFLVLAASPVSAPANDDSHQEEISGNVTQLAEMLSDGYAEEMLENRMIKIISLGEDTKVAVALFTLESFAMGNNATQYLAVFAVLSEGSKGHAQRFSLLDSMAVGGKGWRSVDRNTVKVQKEKERIIISLNTLEYGPKDAMCCPSKKTGAEYSIIPEVGGRLKELRKK